MTADPHDTLDRIAQRVPVPEPAYERFLRRRATLERRRRIATVAAVIIVWVVGAAILVGTVRSGRQPADPSPDGGSLIRLAPGSYRVDLGSGEATAFAPVEGGEEWVPIPPVPGGYAFTLEEDGRRQLWLDSPILGTFPLTDMAWTGLPVWSPDGAFIAFDGQERAGGERRVYIVEIGSGDIVPVTDGASSGATWTRDSRAVYVSVPDGADGSSIVRVDLRRAAGPTQLSVGATRTELTGATSPALAADGRLASIDVDPSTGDGRLSVTEPDGTSAVVATAPGLTAPRWSPDGHTIAYAVEGPDGWETWTVDVETGDVTSRSIGRPSAWEGSETMLVDVPGPP